MALAIQHIQLAPWKVLGVTRPLEGNHRLLLVVHWDNRISTLN